MKRIAVIGLGYVGLPLARLFATRYPVVGYDINQKRILELRSGVDLTCEVDNAVIQAVLSTSAILTEDVPGLYFTSDASELQSCNVYIITVPTPVDEHKRPDLFCIIEATKTVATLLKKGDIVIYESTVYPGVTEEVCVPVLEEISGLTFNRDFFAGYSPERINPGDKIHTVENIQKVTSGSTAEAAKIVDDLYKSVIKAGTHLAPSIRVAEAAKVIENTQRDINIAFVNELAIIFNRLGIDTRDVLDAAGTKWNFLPFSPGLVGGHCIGVDPYYLAQKAQEAGYHPEIILAGRRMNDGMAEYVATRVVKLMNKKHIPVIGSSVLILGITFKENCTDVRNSKVVDIVRALEDFEVNVSVYDPWADADEVEAVYGLNLHTNSQTLHAYDAIILAVAHKEFLSLDLKSLAKSNAVIFDTKSVLPKEIVDGRL